MDSQRKEEVNIRILNRNLPVLATHSELLDIQEAAALLSETIQEYKKQYGVGDDILLLLMSNLDLTTELVRLRRQLKAMNESVNLLTLKIEEADIHL
ncbi:MAG: cell division protein ZapA [Bacteroidia bacterium]|nr:cell division protein ZapA [Bacteroidia bacterium]